MSDFTLVVVPNPFGDWPNLSEDKIVTELTWPKEATIGIYVLPLTKDAWKVELWVWPPIIEKTTKPLVVELDECLDVERFKGAVVEISAFSGPGYLDHSVGLCYAEALAASGKVHIEHASTSAPKVSLRLDSPFYSSSADVDWKTWMDNWDQDKIRLVPPTRVCPVCREEIEGIAIDGLCSDSCASKWDGVNRCLR